MIKYIALITAGLSYIIFKCYRSYMMMGLQSPSYAEFMDIQSVWYYVFPLLQAVLYFASVVLVVITIILSKKAWCKSPATICTLIILIPLTIHQIRILKIMFSHIFACC